MKRLFLVLIPVALLGTLGCQTAKPQAETPPALPSIRLLAYINVSSGCQQATVDFLQGLAQKYPRLVLELVDFGDGGDGSVRWQQSGHKCMTLEIDGRSVVKYPHEGSSKAIAFRMPAGFLWNHEDLEQAVKAAMQGTLREATEEEAMGETSPEQMKAKMDELQKTKAARAGGAKGTKPGPAAKPEKSDSKR